MWRGVPRRRGAGAAQRHRGWGQLARAARGGGRLSAGGHARPPRGRAAAPGPDRAPGHPAQPAGRRHRRRPGAGQSAGVAAAGHQPGGRDRAIEQLMEMSGTTHRLVNGLVVLDAGSGIEHHEIDIDPGARAGLLLFYDHRLYCGVSFDAATTLALPAAASYALRPRRPRACRSLRARRSCPVGPRCVGFLFLSSRQTHGR